MGSSSRFFTKPVITVNLDCDGSVVILGRAEMSRNSNAPTPNACDILASAIESHHPSIEVLVQIRSNAPLIYMSRTAQKETGLNASQMTNSVIEIMNQLT